MEALQKRILELARNQCNEGENEVDFGPTPAFLPTAN